jgi:hypothetical protein
MKPRSIASGTSGATRMLASGDDEGEQFEAVEHPGHGGDLRGQRGHQRFAHAQRCGTCRSGRSSGPRNSVRPMTARNDSWNPASYHKRSGFHRSMRAAVQRILSRALLMRSRLQRDQSQNAHDARADHGCLPADERGEEGDGQHAGEEAVADGQEEEQPPMTESTMVMLVPETAMMWVRPVRRKASSTFFGEPTPRAREESCQQRGGRFREE